MSVCVRVCVTSAAVPPASFPKACNALAGLLECPCVSLCECESVSLCVCVWEGSGWVGGEGRGELRVPVSDLDFFWQAHNPFVSLLACRCSSLWEWE